MAKLIKLLFQNGPYQIVEAKQRYTVLCQGKPFLFRHLVDGRVRYPALTFTTMARAENLAKKLNKMFDTEDFTAC